MVAKRAAPPPRTGEVSEPSRAALLCVSLAEGAILRTLHWLFRDLVLTPRFEAGRAFGDDVRFTGLGRAWLADFAGGGPADQDAIGLGRFTEAENQGTEVGLGKIRRTRPDHAMLGQPVSPDGDDGPYGLEVRGFTLKAQPEPVGAFACGVIAQQPGRAAIGGEQQIEVAVVVYISGGYATGHDGLCKGDAGPVSNVHELPLPVAKNLRFLCKRDVLLHGIDLRLDVPVRRHKIHVSIQVEIHKTQPEGQGEERRPGKAGGPGLR